MESYPQEHDRDLRAVIRSRDDQALVPPARCARDRGARNPPIAKGIPTVLRGGGRPTAVVGTSWLTIGVWTAESTEPIEGFG